MNLLILLDFDGVLFNSAYEAYKVCEYATKSNKSYRQDIGFDEFMEFRHFVIDAWQFNRLYSKKKYLKIFSDLSCIERDKTDIVFAKEFFLAREELIKDKNWIKLFSPYPFFFEIKKLIILYPHLFQILSTRDEVSIKRALDFFEIPEISILGQSMLSRYGSKLEIAQEKGLTADNVFSVYVDDMNYHLEPFQGYVDLCIHAAWGYDSSHSESYTETQAFKTINSLITLFKGKKNS
jgi:hypothetical protein